MKFITVLSLSILFSACGKYEYENSADFNSSKELSPVTLNSDDSKKLRDICDTLSQKEQTISSMAGNKYVFTDTRKNCTDSGFLPIGESNVTLTNQGGSIKFTEGVGNTLYYFPDVETRSEGVMKEICDQTNFESPIRGSDNSLLYFSLRDISPADCQQTTGQTCVQIEKGIVDGSKGKIHTREWLRFKLDQPLLGFWTYRKLTSNGGCLEGSYFGRTATLK